MKFTIRHPYAIEPEAFWRDVFFDREYNEKLYREGLRFEAFEILEETSPPDGRRTRKVRVTPTIDAPAAIKKVIGDSISYVEEGRLEITGPNTPRWISKVLPSKLADKSTIKAEMWLERTGPGQSDRVAEFDIEVKMFGVGGMLEKFLEKSMRESYQKAAEWTNQWLRSRQAAS
ncbi:MAG TPA: DUF2505 domain-containing protein [Nannocystis sp.]